jgi:PAS domain S-box-containing protein
MVEVLSLMADDDDPPGAGAPEGPGGSTQHSSDLTRGGVMEGVGDFDGYFVSVNPAFHRVLGWSVEELTSVPYWELLHPEDQHRSVEFVQEMLISGPGTLSDGQVRMLGRDGCYRWTRWSVSSVRQAERWYARGVDISTRVPVETGRRVRVGSWDWHVRTNTATWSDGMCEIYGLAPGPALSLETALARIHSDDRAVVERVVRAAVESTEPYVADHRIVHPRDGVRWLHSAGRVIAGDDGRPERIRGLTWDVTECPMRHVVG